MKKDYLLTVMTNFNIKIFCDMYIHQNELTKDRLFSENLIKYRLLVWPEKNFLRKIKTFFLLFRSEGCTFRTLTFQYHLILRQLEKLYLPVYFLYSVILRQAIRLFLLNAHFSLPSIDHKYIQINVALYKHY